MNTDDYFKMPAELLRCSGFVSKKTGELVPITHTAKLVFMYMMNRTRFFSEVLSSNHYETQVTIADACGIEYKAAARALKVFVEHNVIIAEKVRNTKISPHKCFYYKSVDVDVELFVGSVGKKPKVEEAVEPKPEITTDTPDVWDDEFLDGLGG